MTRRGGHEFSAEEVVELLAELDARLRRRGVAESIFVVGGAAIAATGVRSGRLTEDVDALTRSAVVLDEAKILARERGLPETWLNTNANMWMPPLPSGVLNPLAEPGLRVIYADDGILLATKLVAQRAKDADDVTALAGHDSALRPRPPSRSRPTSAAITPSRRPWSSFSTAKTSTARSPSWRKTPHACSTGRPPVRSETQALTQARAPARAPTAYANAVSRNNATDRLWGRRPDAHTSRR